MNRAEEGLLPVREILRARQRLSPQEIARLLAGLPEMMDRAGARLTPGPLLHEVLIEFPAEPDLVRLIRENVLRWPPFRLQLGAAPEEMLDPEATLVGPRQVQHGTPAVRFAGLLYEMLGGRLRYEELLAGRYSPLAALGERGNEVLKRALHAGAFADCRSVWEALRDSIETLASEAPEGGRIPGWTIPAALLGAVARADVLDLIPSNASSPPVRVVARPEFRIGRSRRLSDLAILPHEDVESARCVVEELSRVHLMALHTDKGLVLRDGDGHRASSNGSFWQGQPLSSGAPAPIAAPGLLVLSPKGCRYEIEVTPLAAVSEERGEIANFADWAGAGGAPAEEPAAPFAAVAFATPAQFTIMRPALWLRSSVRLEPSPGGEIAWGGQAEPAQILLHRAGAFWIVRTSPSASVRVGLVDLAPGEIAPLTAGQTLRLGAAGFRVELPGAAPAAGGR